MRRKSKGTLSGADGGRESASFDGVGLVEDVDGGLCGVDWTNFRG